MQDTKHVWIGTSWKMNKTLAESLSFAKALQGAPDFASIQRFVIPPFTAVREVKNSLQKTNVLVGAQNMHWDDNGAWTGEISPTMLVDCALDIVELGHSERREFFGETNQTVGLKVAAALRHNLIPLICIGETLSEKENGTADAVLAEQVRGALSSMASDDTQKTILFAYEPVWAIGAGGIPASPEYANERHKNIIATVQQTLGRPVPCLYGGSVNPDNCEQLIQCSHIDGLFIGRSAWDCDGYIDILSRCAHHV